MSSSNIDLDTAKNAQRQLIYDNVKALVNGEEHSVKSFSSSARGQLDKILGSCASGPLRVCVAQCVDCGTKFYPESLIRGTPTIWIGEQCPVCGGWDFIAVL